MAATPGIPSSFDLQTANGQNYASWSLAPGATSYDVQRSTDGVTFASVATPTNPEYLDTAVTIGTQYWYKIAAVNSSGTSPYTTATSCVPVPTGEMSLGQLRLNSQQRADRVNSNFVTKTEWNANINQSLFELYDILVTAYGEEYFVAPPASFTTNSSTQFYALPDGVTTFTSATGGAYVAPPLYKLMGVDMGVNPNTNANGWVSLKKFNFAARNQFFYPNTNSTLYGVYNCLYRVLGNQIEFIPVPSANQTMRVWYTPKMTMLLKDTDITNSSISGWLEYVIVRAAILALTKEESDTSALERQLVSLKTRIEAAAQGRDSGQPDQISDTRNSGWGNGSGPQGGWGGVW